MIIFLLLFGNIFAGTFSLTCALAFQGTHGYFASGPNIYEIWLMRLRCTFALMITSGLCSVAFTITSIITNA